MKSIRTEPDDHSAEGDERIRTAEQAPGADPVYEPVRKVYTVIRWEDDPDRTRNVVGICKLCDKHWPIDVLDPRVVSASGIVHHAEGDTTLCGKRATSDDWWWAL